MPLYSKESLESLKQKIDLVDVIGSHIELKRNGAYYKGCCPFHDEKTPSFMIQQNDTHYHCFGCGAHGDAIAFLMSFQKISFLEAIESLAERYSVHLEKVDEREDKGPSPTLLKRALDEAARFFHYLLLHTPSGHIALSYLYERKIDISMILHFRLGFAPKEPYLFVEYMKRKGFSIDILAAAGLIHLDKGGRPRDFFQERIMIPIHHPTGYIIGFSGRKIHPETYGGKYINTPETVLFKKSKLFFGLNYCRRRIAKERKVLIVEGQFDALRLIEQGLDLTIATQGTAFTESHVKELLALGVTTVYLSFDSDSAGQEAVIKCGHLLQKEAIDVKVVQMPSGDDPDSYVKKNGIEAFIQLMETSEDYLNLLVKYFSKDKDLNSPAIKQQVVDNILSKIQDWDKPLLLQESIKKIAFLLNLAPEWMNSSLPRNSNYYIKKSASVGGIQQIDPDYVLESTLIRSLFTPGICFNDVTKLLFDNLTASDFNNPICRRIFTLYWGNNQEKRPVDLLSLLEEFNEEEITNITSLGIANKNISNDKITKLLIDTIQKILERNWMRKREKIFEAMHQGQRTESELLELSREFDLLKGAVPKVKHSSLG